MKGYTKDIKALMNEGDSTVQQKLTQLEQQYEGETAYIVSAGPSLGKLDADLLNEKLKDKLVISIKQSYEVVAGVSDFHLGNLYNFKNIDYTNKDTIVFYSAPQSFLARHLDKFGVYQIPIDLWVPVINMPTISRDESISFSNDFNLFHQLRTNTITYWGPGMMLELGIPLALLLGCKDIVTIGWDIGAGYGEGHEHFYKEQQWTVPQAGEIAQAVKSTVPMFDWFEQNNLSLSIISDICPADDRFKRLTLENI